jgi:excisionase family DNA binding protein
MSQGATPMQALYTVPEVVMVLRLSRSVVYELLRSGRLRSVAEGRCRRVPAGAIDEYVELLRREQAEREVRHGRTA